MTETVAVPLWLLVLVLAFAGVTFASHFLMPSFRWVLRRRMEHLVASLNRRLQRPIEPFKLLSRHDRIVRLLYDPKVLQAVADHAADQGVPGEVALEEARTYAREIVPGFSALFYFGFATRAARWLSAVFYRVRVGKIAEELAGLDNSASVVFVINHRSNMDYVLVTWLVSGRTALSYAVGEWARVWPLSRLIRAMGAYFIRRNSRNPLYRKVLARYVQMAAEEGAVQAIFPEGGLSLDGRVGAAKLGLLSYFWAGWTRDGNDIVFVPVGLSYDRVLEDELLVQAGRTGNRKFRPRLFLVAVEALRIAVKRVGGRKHLFGSAAASFGRPVSLRAWREADGTLEGLAEHLMGEIETVVPVLPVPFAAAVVLSGEKAADLADRLKSLGAVLKFSPGGADAAFQEGEAALRQRRLIDQHGQPVPGKIEVLEFYAASIRQLLGRCTVAELSAMPQT